MEMNTCFPISFLDTVLEWALRIYSIAVEKTLEGRIPGALGNLCMRALPWVCLPGKRAEGRLPMCWRYPPGLEECQPHWRQRLNEGNGWVKTVKKDRQGVDGVSYWMPSGSVRELQWKFLWECSTLSEREGGARENNIHVLTSDPSDYFILLRQNNYGWKWKAVC